MNGKEFLLLLQFAKHQPLFSEGKRDITSHKDFGRSFVCIKKTMEGLRRVDYGEF